MFGVSRQIFVEVPNTKIHENASGGSQADTFGRADMTKLTDALRYTYETA